MNSLQNTESVTPPSVLGLAGRGGGVIVGNEDYVEGSQRFPFVHYSDCYSYPISRIEHNENRLDCMCDLLTSETVNCLFKTPFRSVFYHRFSFAPVFCSTNEYDT